jgi:DNA mismatch endonuclease (patch repair protein)
MADVFSPAKRSAIMSRISGRNTRPEIVVRKIVHNLGYRFRLHRKDLPGKPDVVLPRHQKIIFVNGCFWHGHARCRRAKLPSSNTAFWQKKLAGNKARDKEVKRRLRRAGWEVLVVWQCEINQHDILLRRLESFLRSKPKRRTQSRIDRSEI